MKGYGILAIVFIFFALGGIIYAGVSTDKFYNENSSSVKIFEYDCAKTFDEYRDIYYNYWDPTLSINYMKNENYQVRLAMAEKEDELLENSCFINVEKWAYKSKYEEEIWSIDSFSQLSTQSNEVLIEEKMTFNECMKEQRKINMCAFHKLDAFYGECLRQEQRNNERFCEEYR